MARPEKRDTIPRLQQLVPHMHDQLLGLRGGATFEEVRQRYISTVDRLVAEGLGRRAASRLNDRDAYWSPTKDVLEEAMRFGFVERQPLPSARKHIDPYREREFWLTEDGESVADLAERDLAGFYDRLAGAAVDAHPYMRRFIVLLRDGALVCPELREGQIEDARREGRDTAYWAQWAAERISSAPGSIAASVDQVREEMVSAVRQRFGHQPQERPSSKALQETLNDAFAAAALASRDLPIGALNLKILRAWGSQLRLLDQSRHVPDFAGSNLIWLASDVYDLDGTLDIHRRGVADHGQEVAAAVLAAYRSQVQAQHGFLAAPYLPIYQVRAEAAFRCSVTRGLVDLVLERLANGDYPELDVQVWLHLGRGDEQPVSEPPYRRGGSRRYEITITRKGEETP